MTRIFKLLIILLSVLNFNLSASQDETKNIAKISAASLYNIDKTSLQKTINAYIQSNKNLKALKITETLSGEIYYQMYKDDDKLYFDKEFPKELQSYSKYIVNSKYEEEVVGKVVAYFNNQNIIKVQLTKEEKQWLKKHKHIKFTADPNYLPYEAFDKDGKYFGMVADYLKIIEKTLDIEFVKIPTKNWSQSLEKAKSGEVDVLSNYTVDDSLKDIHLATIPYIKSPISIITRDDHKKVNSLNELRDKKIAVIKEYGYLNNIFERYSTLNYVEVENAKVGLKGVSSGKYEAVISSLTLASYTIADLGLNNLKASGQTGGIMELGLGVRKDWKEFITIVNKVIKAIPKGKKQEINKKWLGADNILKKKINFTKKEQAWLDKGTAVKYVYDIDWAPFEWKNELGEHTGIISDILSLIEERSGIRFEQVSTNKWSEAVTLMKTDKADMYSGMGENPERKEYLNFTKNTIFKTPYVFVSRENDKNDYLETFKVIKNKKVAVVEGYTIDGILAHNVPKLPLLKVESIGEGFEKVRTKKLDIFIVNAATAKYFINRKGYDDLKIATKTEFNLELKIALQKEMPVEVLSIIDKSIKSLNDKELSDIYFKWTEVLVESKTNWDLIYKIAGGSLFLLLLIVYWNRKLKKAVDEKTQELTSLLHSFDKNVIASNSDIKGNITYASDALCEISGYSKGELLGQPHNILRHPQTPKETFKELWKTIQNGKTWTGEIKNKKKNGGFYWVYAIITPEFDAKQNITGYSAIRHDITSQKEVEELSASLEHKVEERTAELNGERQYINAIMNSQTNMVISTDGFKLRSANKAFFDFFDVNNEDEFMKKLGNCICDTFDINASKEYLQKMIDDEKWIDYIYARPNQIHKAIIKRENKKYIFTITADNFTFKGENLKTAVFTDISELEAIRENMEMILSNIMLPVLITSKEDRTILYANEYASKQYETTIEELIGTNIDEVYTNLGQKDEILDELEKYGYVENLEERYRTRKGKEFIALLSVKPILYNTQEAYIGMVVDITEQKNIEEEIRTIHKHTRDSIEYASLIQQAIVPDNGVFKKYFKDFFTIWQPKDIVGGDIYLFEELRHDDECLLMVIDCTGHGVPGAFVTMLVKAIERQVSAIIASDVTLEVSPAWILKYFNMTMKKLLKQENDNSISNAGFDGGVIYYNKKEKILKFSGAETPLFYIDENQDLKTIKGSRHSIGYKKSDINFEFKEHTIEVKDGMQFYLTTDGYIDQNGGAKGFPFGKKQFSRIVGDNKIKPFEEQKEIFLDELLEYQQDEERNDDVTVIGFEIGKL